MKAGKELDALIAKRVMGYVYSHCDGVRCPTCSYDGLYGSERDVPGYSTDIAAAWPLVERFGLYVGPHGKGVFLAQDDLEMPSIRAQGESGPHAICLAALKAVGALS